MNVTIRILALLVAWFLTGCHSGAPRVNCENHLTPINTPAPASDEPEVRP